MKRASDPDARALLHSIDLGGAIHGQGKICLFLTEIHVMLPCGAGAPVAEPDWSDAADGWPKAIGRK